MTHGWTETEGGNSADHIHTTANKDNLTKVAVDIYSLFHN